MLTEYVISNISINYFTIIILKNETFIYKVNIILEKNLKHQESLTVLHVFIL